VEKQRRIGKRPAKRGRKKTGGGSFRKKKHFHWGGPDGKTRWRSKKQVGPDKKKSPPPEMCKKLQKSTRPQRKWTKKLYKPKKGYKPHKKTNREKKKHDTKKITNGAKPNPGTGEKKQGSHEKSKKKTKGGEGKNYQKRRSNSKQVLQTRGIKTRVEAKMGWGGKINT